MKLFHAKTQRRQRRKYGKTLRNLFFSFSLRLKKMVHCRNSFYILHFKFFILNSYHPFLYLKTPDAVKTLFV